MNQESNLSHAARKIFIKEDIRFTRKAANWYIMCGALEAVCFAVAITGDLRAGTNLVNWLTLTGMTVLLATTFWTAWACHKSSKSLSRQLASLNTR